MFTETPSNEKIKLFQGQLVKDGHPLLNNLQEYLLEHYLKRGRSHTAYYYPCCNSISEYTSGRKKYTHASTPERISLNQLLKFPSAGYSIRPLLSLESFKKTWKYADYYQIPFFNIEHTCFTSEVFKHQISMIEATRIETHQSLYLLLSSKNQTWKG